MDTGTKVSLAVILLLVLTAFVDFRISAALATAYLVGYGVYSMRKARKRKELARNG